MYDAFSPELISASIIAIRDCMGAKPGESLLIVTDEPLRAIGFALRQAAKDLGHNVILVEILPRTTNGEEPAPQVAHLMTKVDVVLCPTSKSLTHTDARRAASAAGVRVGTLPGVTEDIMVRCMNADYHRIAERTERLCVLMEKTATIRVEAPAGTNILLPNKSMGGTVRVASHLDGLVKEPSVWFDDRKIMEWGRLSEDLRI